MSEFLLGGNVLEAMGIPYVEDGGPLIAKLSPGTYLAGAAMIAWLTGTGNPLQATWLVTSRERLLAGYFAAILFCVAYACCMTGPGGVVTLIDTFLPAAMIAVAIYDIDDRQAAAIRFILQVLFVTDATLALTEAAAGAHLVTMWGAATTSLDFRPAALYDHPLTGAAATMMGLLLAPERRAPVLRLVYQFWMFAALLAFGGRAALVVSLAAAVSIFCLRLARKILSRRLGVADLLAPAVVLLAGVALVVSVMVFGLADRLAEHLYWDRSAQARIGQFQLLRLLNTEQIMFGCRRDDLIALIEPLRLAYGVDVIENFWVLMLATLGVFCFPVFVGGLLALLRWLWLRGGVEQRAMVAGLLVVASTSNSFGRKSTLLVTLVGCVLAHVRPRLIERKYARNARNPVTSELLA